MVHEKKQNVPFSVYRDCFASDFLPLARRGDREAALRVGLDGDRTVGVQVVQVVAEQEPRLHHVVPRDLLADMAGGPAHECREVGIDRPLELVVRPVVADGVDERVPLVLPRTERVFRRRPGDVVLFDPLVLEQVDGRGVRHAGELGGAFGAVDEGGELAVRVVHPPELAERLASVGEGVLDGVDVDVLAAIGAARPAAAQAVRRDRPGILDPAAFVDLVDQVVDHVARAHVEQVDPPEFELAHQPVGVGAHVAEPAAAFVAVGADQRDVAHRAVADLLDQRLAGGRVSALEPGEDLDALLLGLFARGQKPVQAAWIGGEGLLHEHVDPLPDRVLDVDRSDVRPGCAQGDIARPQAIDRLLIPLEPDELPLAGDIDPVLELVVQSLALVLHAFGVQIGHRVELHRPAVGHGQGVPDGPGAAPAAAEQRQADGVVGGRMEGRSQTPEHSRPRGDGATTFEEFPAVDLG